MTKILIIDEEANSRKKIQKLLAKAGECTAVETQEDAFEIFQRFLNEGKPFDLVLKRIFFKPKDALKILVADDELVSRSKLQKWMNRIGDCTAVKSGKEAIRSFQEAFKEQKPFDLVMLDVSMPEMDGTETLLHIRTFEHENRVPKEKMAKIMMVTAFVDKETIIACRQAGCDAYIKKPFNREVIIKKLVGIGLIDKSKNKT